MQKRGRLMNESDWKGVWTSRGTASWMHRTGDDRFWLLFATVTLISELSKWILSLQLIILFDGNPKTEMEFYVRGDLTRTYGLLSRQIRFFCGGRDGQADRQTDREVEKAVDSPCAKQFIQIRKWKLIKLDELRKRENSSCCQFSSQNTLIVYVYEQVTQFIGKFKINRMEEFENRKFFER